MYNNREEELGMRSPTKNSKKVQGSDSNNEFNIDPKSILIEINNLPMLKRPSLMGILYQLHDPSKYCDFHE